MNRQYTQHVKYILHEHQNIHSDLALIVLKGVVNIQKYIKITITRNKCLTDKTL